MNATLQAQRGYSAISTTTGTAKSIEYEVIAKITRRMQKAASEGKSGFPALVAALHDNKKLWNLFAIDLADPGNKYPSELKARLFYLAEFTNHHTSKVLAREDSADPLLDINMSILRGLRDQGN